jgi:minor histocompatibility antigen H13
MTSFKENQKMMYWGILLAFLVLSNWLRIPIWIQLIANSVSAVALGALYSITLQQQTKDANSPVDRKKSDSKDGETMSMSDALKFPFQASFALLVLYVLFNNVDNGLLLKIFKLNFALLGITCLSAFVVERVPIYAPQLANEVIWDRKFRVWGEEVHVHLTTHYLVAYLVAGAVNVLYLWTDHWTTNNILGISFTIAGIMLLKVPNFKIIFAMLWALFLYDIFWVFGSDVMVTVATKFDVPIKLKFPDGTGRFSILGLGDMVIPGIIVALSLKFDVDSFLKMGRQAGGQTKMALSNMKTPVFYGAFVGYIVGIIATIVSMYVFNHPQPALLFLVPGCTLGILLPAVYQKKVMELWRYDAEEDVIEKEKTK